MGKARTNSPRKQRSKASLSPVTRTAAIADNGNSNTIDTNNSYESFPIIPRVSRSRSLTRTPGAETTEVEDNLFLVPMSLPDPPEVEPAKSFEDPGNPLGNAVDFCVNGVSSLHEKSMTLPALKPCHDVNIHQTLEDLFLCNILAGRIEGTANSGTTEDGTNGEATNKAYPTTSSTNGGNKNGRKKKSLKIVPGKKFLRSMSLKRSKKSTTAPNHTAHAQTDEDDIWNGITDDAAAEPSVKANDDVQKKADKAADSDEDTIFTNLEESEEESVVTIRPPESQKSKSAPSKEKKELGDEGPPTQDGRTDDASCHLFFSASSLCAISTLKDPDEEEVKVDADAIPEKGDLVIPRNFEKEKPMESIQTRKPKAKKTTKKAKIAVVPSTTPPSGGRAGREDGQDVPKVEYEMILDTSRFGNRKWGKITPWKKLENMFASTSSQATAKSSKSAKSNSRSSVVSQSSSRSKQSDYTFGQNSILQSSNATDEEIARGLTKNESYEETTELEIVLYENSQILRKRRLQSALRGLSSRKSGGKRTPSISKARRSSWKKMLIVSVPPGQNSKRRLTTKRSSTEPPAMASSAKAGSNYASSTRPQKGEDHSVESADTRSTNGCSASRGSTSRASTSNPLEYSESDEETSAAKSENTGNKMSVKDRSSTSIMGLHKLSWGVFYMDPREEDEEEFPDDESKSQRKANEGLSLPFFGAAEEHDHGRDDSHNGARSQSSSVERDDSFSNHDGWIMNEDQLESFEDDDTRKTGDSSRGSSSSGSVTSDDETEEEDDDDDDDICNEESENNTKFSKEKSNTTATAPQEIQGRKGLAALSKSIAKTFSHKRKKSKGSVDISGQSEAITRRGDPSRTETIIQKKKGRQSPKFVFSTEEDRRDDRSSSKSKRSSIANSAKKFWKLQSTNSNPTASVSAASTATSTTTTGGSRRRFQLKRRNSMNSNASPSKDVITVVTKPNHGRSRSNDYLDRFTASLLDFYEAEHDEESSYSTSSRSWARDDEDSRSVDLRHHRYECHPSSQEVIRE